MSQSQLTWVVVADAGSARIFSYTFKVKPWKLVREFSGSAGDEETTPSQRRGLKAERPFSHEILQVLEQGMVANAFGHIVLVAPPKLLGELREHLGRGLQPRVVKEIGKDYTGLTAKELKGKLVEELPEIV